MTNDLKILLRDALLNNTYDYSVVHETLKNTWTNSYSYLYQLQKSFIEYEERTYISNNNESKDFTHIGHLYLNKSLYACFDIDYDFIHVSNREEFKRSEFHNTQFTFNDMVNNPNIFLKLPIIIIDNQAIWDYKIQANNGSFTIILPFKQNFVLDKRCDGDTDTSYLEHNIQVFIVSNILYERVTLNKRHVLNTTNKTLTLDTALLTKTTTNEGVYFLSVHVPNILGNNYELGTILMPCIKVGDKLTCQLSDKDYSRISKTTKSFYISVIFVDKLHQHTFYTGNPFTICKEGDCNLFILQRDECVPYAMPIPVENLMILKRRNGDLTYVKNTDAVELFYPNIYRIKDVDRRDGDIYYIYYFYHYAESLKYTPTHHDFYYEFLKIHFNNEPIEKIVDNIYYGKFKYIEDIDTDGENTVYLDCPDSEDDVVLDYILVCGSSENTSSYVINGDEVTPAIVNEAFINTFNRVLHYEYYKYNYGDIDFVKRYILVEGNSDKDPIEYKDETLKAWIHENPDILRDYVINQNKLYNPVYHLWTKNIDLESRLRIDTTPEFGQYGTRLSEECYVFSFHNDQTLHTNQLLNIRVFVDGLMVTRMTHLNQYYNDYIYIPKVLVTEDSYIEIEIFPSYEHSEILNFKSLQDEREISLIEPSDGIYPTIQDVFYIEPSGHMIGSVNSSYTKSTPSNGDDTIEKSIDDGNKLVVNGEEYSQTKFYTPDSFQLTSHSEYGDYIIRTYDSEKPVVFTRLSSFKIKPKSKDVLNTDICFCIGKVPHGIEIKVQNDTIPYISLVGMNFTFDSSYIRIFKNGRLVPETKYSLVISDSFPRILFFDFVNAGDILYIDITPYRYRQIYFKEEIVDYNGAIDLTGYIDKPFDIRYYDVYLNGRKLSLNNVISISPWKIALRNIKSKYNLAIFEKERDYEYFGTDFRTNKYYYTIDDLLESDYILDDEKRLLIDRIIDTTKDPSLTIIPNENTEEKIDHSEVVNKDAIFEYMFYTNIVIPTKFINPDQLQLNKHYIKTSYSSIYDKYHIKPSDFARNDEEFNRKSEYNDVFMLDPDVLMENQTDVGNVVVYPITHLDTVDESMFDTNITE